MSVACLVIAAAVRLWATQPGAAVFFVQDALAEPSPADSLAGDTAAMRLAAEVREVYLSAEGLSMDFEQASFWADDPELKEISRGKLWTARGNKLRMEYSEPPGHLLVSDGVRVWVYVPENGQAVVDSLEGPGQGPLGEMLLDLLCGRAVREVRTEEIDGVQCRVLEVRDVEQEVGLELIKVWIEPERRLIRALQLTDANGNVTRFSFRKIRRMTEVKQGLFTFEAPPGVEVVESPLTGGGR